MAYTIYNTDGTILLTMADNAIDNVATSLDLIGKNVNNYGESFNNNMVRLLTNFASTPENSPNSPQAGQTWFDTEVKQLKVYDGTSFTSLVGSTSATSTSGFASITYVDSVVANSTMSFASSLQTLQTSFTALDTKTAGSYTNLVSLISNSTATIVSQITTLSAKFDTLTTGTGATVSYVDLAVANSTASIASSLQTLQTNFTNLQTQTAGSYTNLVSLISSSTGTISTRVSSLESSFSSLTTSTGASISYVDTAVANSTASLSSRVITLEAKVASASTTTGASIAYVDTAVANSTASIASSLSTLQTNFTNLQTQTAGSYTNLVSLISSSTGTLSTKVSTLESNYSSLSSAVSSKASVSYVDSAVSGANSSLASSVQTLTSTVNAQTTTVSTLQSSVNGMTGKYAVSVNANGAATGFQILGGSATSSFIVNAANFKVAGLNSDLAIFSVDTANQKIQMNANVVVQGNISANQISGGRFSGASIGIGSGHSLNGYAFDVSGAGVFSVDNIFGGIGYFDNFYIQTSSAISAATASNSQVAISAYAAYGVTGAAALLAAAPANGTTFQAGGIYAAASLAGQGRWKCADGVIPFTGIHEVLMVKGHNAVPGDILVDYKTIYKQSIASTLEESRLSSQPAQKGVVGIFNKIEEYAPGTPTALWSAITPMLTDEDKSPMPILTFNSEFDQAEIESQYDAVLINAIGDGQINVCGENGDIAIGDLIVTSSIPGKGMKQDDDLVRSYTVAKARESVTFSTLTEVKMISCIYMCG